MKKQIALLCALCFVFAVGCTSNANVTVSKTENADEEATTSTTTQPVSTTEETSVVGKRSNPIPLGNTATWDLTYYGSGGERVQGNVSLTFSEVVRGDEAYNSLLTFNRFNKVAPEGYEWLYFTATLTLNEGSADIPYTVTPNFIVFDSSGSEVSQSEYATFLSGEEFGFKSLFVGGTATGKVGKFVPIDDKVLIEYRDWNNEDLFFALQ